MESNRFTRKLAKWAFILQEYNFDIVHRSCKVNHDADGLSWTQIPTMKILLRFIGMVMLIWKYF
jgi:hypothetical protein